MKAFGKALLFSSAMVASTHGVAHADVSYSVATGVEFSSGDYGEAVDTEVIAAPLIFKVAADDWTFRASTLYLQVKGPADVADLFGGGDSGSDVTRAGTVSGLGDTTLSVSRAFSRIGSSDVYLEATARVRLPTGDETKGLGVGVVDYAAAGEIGVNKRGGGASLEVTRRFLGDRAGVERRDGWQVNPSAWLRISEHTQAGVFGYWREASVEDDDDPAQAGVFLSRRVTQNLRVSVNASAGLSDASPNYSTGVRLTWRLSED